MIVSSIREQSAVNGKAERLLFRDNGVVKSEPVDVIANKILYHLDIWFVFISIDWRDLIAEAVNFGTSIHSK